MKHCKDFLIALTITLTISMNALAEEACQITLPDAGIHVKMLERFLIQGGGVGLTLNFSNKSDISYTVSQVNVKFCKVFVREDLTNEIKFLEPHTTITQHYICENRFSKSNDINIKTELKSKDLEKPIITCDII